MAQVICAKLLLESVLCLAFWTRHDSCSWQAVNIKLEADGGVANQASISTVASRSLACIRYQDVELFALLQESLCSCPDGLERSKVKV